MNVFQLQILLSVIWCVIGMDEITRSRRIDLRLCGSDARCAPCCALNLWRCHLVPCTSSRLLACVFDHRVLSVIWCVIGMDEIASDRRIDLRLCGSDARCASRCCRQEMSSRAVYKLTVARLRI
jgi:hypothetical protein